MIYSLTGKLIHKDAFSAVIECGGVAFKCITTLNTLGKIEDIGNIESLYTYLYVREDILDLYGFADINELECFKYLISVSGVGPKAAVAILSELAPDKLALAVATGDSKSLTKAPGIGAKTAQRIVLELKDKFKSNQASGFKTGENSEETAVFESSGMQEAVSALVMLGYTRSEATAAVSKVDAGLTVQEIIKNALKQLSRQV